MIGIWFKHIFFFITRHDKGSDMFSPLHMVGIWERSEKFSIVVTEVVDWDTKCSKFAVLWFEVNILMTI